MSLDDAMRDMRQKQWPSRTQLTFPTLVEQQAWNLTNHAPDADQVERFELVREFLKAAGEAIAILVPGGRELAMANTKLEELTMQAIAGIARSVPAA